MTVNIDEISDVTDWEMVDAIVAESLLILLIISPCWWVSK
jgi:hypothetical protein